MDVALNIAGVEKAAWKITFMVGGFIQLVVKSCYNMVSVTFTVSSYNIYGWYCISGFYILHLWVIQELSVQLQRELFTAAICPNEAR